MVLITSSSIDSQAVLDHVRSNLAGAVCLFLGTTREITGDKRTLALHYEAYSTMAIRKLEEIESRAKTNWTLTEVAIVHRLGRLELGEISVAVATSSPHRRAAFESCSWIMDEIKGVVPIWKREIWADGTEDWVHPGLDSHPGP